MDNRETCHKLHPTTKGHKIIATDHILKRHILEQWRIWIWWVSNKVCLLDALLKLHFTLLSLYCLLKLYFTLLYLAIT